MGDAWSPAMSSPLHELERPQSDRRTTLRDRRARLPQTDDASADSASHAHILQVVQPGLLGLMDGSVSTLAPLFATATLTGRTESAFLVGLAASVGAGISMGLAEALSDDGQISGRGKPLMRGVITGGGTVIGGMLHTLPFLLGNLRTALLLAYAVVVVELLAIAYIRYRWMHSPLGRTVMQVIVGGGIVFGLGIWLGRFGAGG
jgi:erythrin-vacuolar iron transport family protein